MQDVAIPFWEEFQKNPEVAAFRFYADASMVKKWQEDGKLGGLEAAYSEMGKIDTDRLKFIKRMATENTVDCWLELALTYKSRNDVFLLVQVGANVNMQPHADKLSPLLLAAWEGWEEVVDALVKIPELLVNVREEKGDTALILASMEGYEKIVAALLTRPEINIAIRGGCNLTAREWAERCGHLGVIEEFENYMKR